jgi:diazepam-binding inhibitor (GABA receptor modulating acyl-CoA-binding protein)
MNSIMILAWTLCASLVVLVRCSEDFELCTRYVRTSKPRAMKESDMLRAYGLYKQGTSGDCDPTLSASSDKIENAKRQAWCSEKGKQRDAAQAEYVMLMDKLAPEWRSFRNN